MDLFDLQNDLGGQSRKSKLFLEKLVEQIVTDTYLSQNERKYELRVPTTERKTDRKSELVSEGRSNLQRYFVSKMNQK